MSDQSTFATVDGHVSVDTIALLVDIDLSETSIRSFAADLAADFEPSDPMAATYSSANLLAAAAHLRTCDFCGTQQQQIAGAMASAWSEIVEPEAAVRASQLNVAQSAFAVTAVSAAAAPLTSDLAASRTVSEKKGLLSRVFRGGRSGTGTGTGAGGVSVGSNGVAWRTPAIGIASAALLAIAVWGITRGSGATEVGSPPMAKTTEVSTVVANAESAAAETTSVSTEPSMQAVPATDEAAASEQFSEAASETDVVSAADAASAVAEPLPATAGESSSGGAGSGAELQFDAPAAQSAPQSAAQSASAPSTSPLAPKLADPIAAAAAPAARATSAPATAAAASAAQPRSAAAVPRKKSAQVATAAADAQPSTNADGGSSKTTSEAAPLATLSQVAPPPPVAASPAAPSAITPGAPAATRTANTPNTVVAPVFIGALSGQGFDQILNEFNNKVPVKSSTSSAGPSGGQSAAPATTTVAPGPPETAAPSAAAMNTLEVTNRCISTIQASQSGTQILYSATATADGTLLIVLRRSLGGQIEDLIVTADCTKIFTRLIS